MIDALLASLKREAEAQIAATLAESREQAGAITTASEQRIAQECARTLERREAAARAESARALQVARQTQRGRVLAGRAAFLDRVFAELRAMLPALATTPSYRTRLAGDLARAVAFVGDQPATIHCPSALEPVLRDLIATNGHLRIHPDGEITTGFRVITTDGSLEVDDTLEGLLERQRPGLALAALAELS